MENNMKFILPINDNIDNKMSLQFSSILSNKDYYPWFYENYINIFIRGENEFVINYTDNVDYNCILLCQNIADYKIFDQDHIVSVDALSDILERMLTKRYYNQVWVDEFYIKSSSYYNKYNFVHPLLIYGIDNTCKYFYCRMFNQDKGDINCKISYAELYIAVKSATDYYYLGDPYKESIYRTIKSYIYKTPCILPFNLNTFKLNFEDYLFSKPSDINRRLLYLDKLEIAYGIKVYDILIDILENIEIKHISFGSFNNFIISKYNILDRLKYIQQVFQLDLIDEICKYEKICNNFEKLKLLNIKNNIVKKKQVNDLCTDKIYINKVLSTLRLLKVNEINILFEVYKKICKYLNNFSKNGINDMRYEYTNDIIKVVFDKPQYLYEINVLLNKEKSFSPVGIIIVNDYTYLTNKKNIKIKDISFNLIAEKVYYFEYKLLNYDVISAHDIFFSTIGYTNSISIKPENSLYNSPECLKDLYLNDKFNFKYIIMGNDPSLIMINLNTPVLFKYIYIKCKIKSTSSTAQLFFSTSKEFNFSEANSKIITVNNKNEYIEYKIDMSDNINWKDLIKDIRFDPAHYDNTDNKGEFIMEYLEISSVAPKYISSLDYNSVQGVNGWFYYSYDLGITYKEISWSDENRCWGSLNNIGLYISNNKQTSCNRFISVRKWVCPANGEYKVLYKFNQTTNGTFTNYSFKHNHKLIEKHMFDNKDGKLTSEHIQYVKLEYGEGLFFEFCNEDEITIECVDVEIIIEKVL